MTIRNRILILSMAVIVIIFETACQSINTTKNGNTESDFSQNSMSDLIENSEFNSNTTSSYTNSTNNVNQFIELSKNESSYLMLLYIIGECYIDYTLSEDSYKKIETHSDISNFVKQILDYKYKNNELLPDFSESFSLYWNDDVADRNPDVAKSLKLSFDLKYQVIKKQWRLEPIKIYTFKGESYIDFEGHYKEGVTIYLNFNEENEDNMVPYYKVI
jgi:hypothetical protein